MSKDIAFFVDGDLEKRFLQQVCAGSAIRKVGNGDNFPVKVLSKQIMSLVRLLGNRYRKIVVMVDLERRNLTHLEFADQIRCALLEDGIAQQSFCVYVKEREAEDWILADPESLAEYVGEVVDVVGRSGKGGLSRLLAQFGIKYNETTIGCDLLKSVICSRAVVNSPSLAHFRNDFGEECWWLDR